jgi:Zn-dependent protease
MFDLPSVRIGRLFGIPVEVNASWLLIVGLVGFTLTFDYYPSAYPGRPMIVDALDGLATTALFFASIVLHEMSHSLVAKAGGVRISRIVLFVFGGVAQMEEEPGSPGREFVMAVAGPAMSVLLAGLSLAGYAVLALAGASSAWWAPLLYVGLINISVAVFNLLPGFPLDGGRVLRAVLWKVTGDLLKATRWASAAGRAIGWTLVAAAVLGVLRGSLDFAWLGLVGWFLTNMSRSAYRDQVLRTRLASVSVGSHMSSPPVVAPGHLTLQEMIDRFVYGGRHSRYPVEVDGAIVGLLDMDVLKRVPSDQWVSTRVADVVTPVDEGSYVAVDAGIDTVLGRLGPDGPGALLVTDGGEVVGIVTRADVIRTLREPDAGGWGPPIAGG